MILCRSPLRVSFFGGGTDFEYYIKENIYGATLSCAIDKYVYLTINNSANNFIKLNYSKLEKIKNIKLIKHKYFKKIIEQYNFKNGIEISSHSNIESGVGLSSSSAFGAGLILLSDFYLKKKTKKLWIKSYKFEKYTLKNLCGMQDQFIISNGGIRYTQYYKNFKTLSKKIKITKKILSFFNNNMVLINTGINRDYNKIANDQKKKVIKNNESLKNLRDNAKIGYDLLKRNKFKEFGMLINKSWSIKKSLTPYISNNPKIKNLEKKLNYLNIWGCKILGAGGGGMMLVCGSTKTINNIRKNAKFNTIDFKPTDNKAEIIYSE